MSKVFNKDGMVWEEEDGIFHDAAMLGSIWGDFSDAWKIIKGKKSNKGD